MRPCVELFSSGLVGKESIRGPTQPKSSAHSLQIQCTPTPDALPMEHRACPMSIFGGNFCYCTGKKHHHTARRCAHQAATLCGGVAVASFGSAGGGAGLAKTAIAKLAKRRRYGKLEWFGRRCLQKCLESTGRPAGQIFSTCSYPFRGRPPTRHFRQEGSTPGFYDDEIGTKLVHLLFLSHFLDPWRWQTIGWG